MKKFTPSFKIAFTYFIFSFLWILLSDKVVLLFTQDIEAINFIQTMKGWFFITISSLIIYYFTNKFFKKEKQAREKIEKIFNQAATPIALFNEDNELLKINKVWEEKSGYKLEEINTLEKWSNLAYKEDAKAVQKRVKSYYNINKKTSIGEINILSKDQKDLIWHFDIAPYGIIDGKKVFIASIVDMTELRKHEAMLIQQSKMATMGEMIGNITHQWKQPLSIISIANNLINLRQQSPEIVTEEEVLKSINDINSSVEYLSQTIDDFKNFFSPNKKSAVFDISETISKTLKLISSQLKNQNIKVIQDIKSIEANGYENELLQVLINLLKNSKDQLIEQNKFDEKLIFITTYQDKEDLIISVKDNAKGIPEEILAKIFNAYFSTKEENEGSGIGLYMSKHIIQDRMNGILEAKNITFNYEDIEYKGAEFIIKIPTNITKTEV